MKTTDILIIGGLAVGAYFLFKNSSPSDKFISTYGGVQQQLPTASTSINNVAFESPSVRTLTKNAKETNSLITSSRNNVYDRTTGTIKIGGQGFSVAPERVGRLIVQQTTGQAQTAFPRFNVNPYSGF